MRSKKVPAHHYVRQNVWLSLALFLPVALAVMAVIPARSFQLGGEVVSRVNTEEKVVAITFDDGPQPEHTDKIIRTLTEHKVPATFFLIGVEMERHPGETRKLIDAGFEIGNHSYRHDSLVFKTIPSLAKDIESTDRLIRQAGYGGTIHVRPPYGHKWIELPYYLSQHSRPTIMWSIAPDENDPSQLPGDIVSNVLSEIQPGSVIVLHAMHDHNAPTRKALPQIITRLKDQGYSFVTVSQLLGYR